MLQDFQYIRADSLTVLLLPKKLSTYSNNALKYMNYWDVYLFLFEKTSYSRGKDSLISFHTHLTFAWWNKFVFTSFIYALLGIVIIIQPLRFIFFALLFLLLKRNRVAYAWIKTKKNTSKNPNWQRGYIYFFRFFYIDIM